MKKILKNIKNFLFDESNIIKKTEKVLKSKRISDNNKFITVINYVGDYYINQHEKKILKDCYDIYTDYYPLDFKIDAQKFSKIFKELDETKKFDILFDLTSIVNKLDINMEKLSKKQKDIYLKIKSFEQMYNSYAKKESPICVVEFKYVNDFGEIIISDIKNYFKNQNKNKKENINKI